MASWSKRYGLLIITWHTSRQKVTANLRLHCLVIFILASFWIYPKGYGFECSEGYYTRLLHHGFRDEVLQASRVDDCTNTLLNLYIEVEESSLWASAATSNCSIRASRQVGRHACSLMEVVLHLHFPPLGLRECPALILDMPVIVTTRKLLSSI